MTQGTHSKQNYYGKYVISTLSAIVKNIIYVKMNIIVIILFIIIRATVVLWEPTILGAIKLM